MRVGDKGRHRFIPFLRHQKGRVKRCETRGSYTTPHHTPVPSVGDELHEDVGYYSNHHHPNAACDPTGVILTEGISDDDDQRNSGSHTGSARA